MKKKNLNLVRIFVIIITLCLIFYVISATLCVFPVTESRLVQQETISQVMTDENVLSKLLAPSSCVLDITESLSRCNNQELVDSFQNEFLLPRVRGIKIPSSRDDFICNSKCFPIEPELEKSLRYLGGSQTKYYAKSLSRLCESGRVPLLIKVSNNQVFWTKCRPGKLSGSRVWFSAQRLLFVLSKLVTLPDIIFAFDNSDFSRPNEEDPNGLNWMWTVPGIVRFVGDSSHPSILWPTYPYVSTTAYCNFEEDEVSEAVDWVLECKERRMYPWNEKRNIVFWRGSPTGYPIEDELMQFMPRSMLNKQFALKPGYDIGFGDDSTPPYANENFKKSHFWTKRVRKSDFGKYQMIFSLDGHTASWGLIEKLGLGSLLLIHQSLKGYREFYYELLEPYQHFIPISFDFSNLEKVRLWVLTHEGNEKAEQIAKQALELMKTRMRPQDLWCYLFRLIETLASKQGFPVSDSTFEQFKWAKIDLEAVTNFKKSLYV